jgi:hypothetical protein
VRRKKHEENIPAAQRQGFDLVAQGPCIASHKTEEEAKFGRSNPEAEEGNGDHLPAYPFLRASI